jgi:farnesol dehydrogenase
MRVLITGGTGFLGSALVRACARAGHLPVVFARRASSSGLPGQLIDGDVRDRAALARAASGVDAICHSAALVSGWQRDRSAFDAVNIGGLENALEVCRSQRVPRFLYTSSFLALPPAGHSSPLTANDYQRTKVAAREVARRASDRGLPVLTLVPGVIYGPGGVTEANLVGRLLRDHLTRQLPGIIGGTRIWSFTYIDDVVAAHVAALSMGNPGDEFAIGGENRAQVSVFELLRQWRGTRLPRDLPLPVARALGRIEETRARVFGGTPLLTAGAVDILAHDWPLDSQQGRDILGIPLTPLAVGLATTLQHLTVS